jgi:hypothetical protein
MVEKVNKLLKNTLQFIKQRLFAIAFLAVLISFLVLRIALYGDPRLAIGIIDTPSYITSSQAPVFSWESFTGRRLFTMNLVYKIISDGKNCGQITLSMPAVTDPIDREIQPCFDNLALLQALLSITGWLWLTIAITRHLHKPLAKILTAIILLAFAFSPQIAEWDNVLSSESLSLSLFAISFGTLIEIAFILFKEYQRSNLYKIILFSVWFISFGLWLFVRDANLYAILITLALLAPVLLMERSNLRRTLIICSVVLGGLLLLGVLSSRQSSRWQPSISHSFDTYLLPYPQRVGFLEKNFKMPDPNSSDFTRWFDRSAPTAFVGFLASHPGFDISTILQNWVIFVTDYTQPYYRVIDQDTRKNLLLVGEILHPNTSFFYLADTILLISFLAAALYRRTFDSIVWAWLFTWLYLTSAITLFVSFFGDTDGMMRHVLPSLVTFRLFLWMAMLVHIDAFIIPTELTKPQL